MFDAIKKLIEFDRVKRLNIAIIGDSMLDVYVHGRFESCQENCPKFVETSRIRVPGGAANAARQLANWNARSWLISITGFGGSARQVRSLRHEYENELTFQCGEVPIKERFLIDGEITFRHDDEHVEYDLTESELMCCRNTAFNAIKEKIFDAVLISDYDKGFMDEQLIRDVIDECHLQKIPVVFDAKRHWSIYRSRSFGYSGGTLKCNSSYADKYLQDSKVGNIVITHGQLTPTVCSALYYENGRQPCRSLHCLNHVGAGDCFSAHLILGLAHGLSLKDSAAIGHSAGRCYVQHEHGRPPFPHEIRRDLEPVDGKILSPVDLPSLRKSIAGKMVFTNGVFRLMTAAHCWFLNWARSQGDCLVVGVNTNDSAYRIGRGFVATLEERMDMLAAMEALTFICPFDEDTPYNLIEQLLPDVLCKGHDAENTYVPGSDLVADLRFSPKGPYPDRHATTLIEDILKYSA
jgi:D-beta-D-heptose 7-phosphate kinase/D-beta-D-heptose 1-phosphate adenosyltransferase